MSAWFVYIHIIFTFDLMSLLYLPIVDSYLEVALVCVEDDRLFSVIDPLHLQCQPADSRLEIGLLCVHHQADTILIGMLKFKKKIEFMYYNIT